MNVTLKLQVIGTHQSNEGLVDQCGGLKRVIWAFRLHESSSQRTQLVIDQWQQLSRRSVIAGFDFPQNQADLCRLICSHEMPV